MTSNYDRNYSLTMEGELLLCAGFKPKFGIGDYVRLGNDMPYQITTTAALINCHKIAGYRSATEEERELAKLYKKYKKRFVEWDTVLKEWKRLSK